MKKQIGKRLLSIMLTLALVFTMIPMMPGAVQKVEAAETETINITGLDLNPVVGQVPDTTAECDKEYVTMVIVEWYDFKDATDNSNAVKITGNIDVGMDVKCKVTVFSATGAIPVNATATINGGAYGFVRESGNIMSCFIPFGVMTPQVPDTIEITGLDLDISANEVLDTTVSANTNAVTCEVQWTDDTGNKLTKAEYWSTPKMRLVIRPVEDYAFTSSPKVKVNGALVETSKLSDSEGISLVYTKKFSQIVAPADKVIKEVGISGSDYGRENLVIGKAPVLDYTCLDDRVNFACWYEDDITGNRITKFAAGQQPRLKFEITPKDGYVFPYDEKVTVYVNGHNVFTHGDSTFKRVTASVAYAVLKYNDIRSLNITDYTKPSPNHAPDTEFGLSDTNVASATFEWTDSNGNPVTKFEAGKTYTCTATLVGKSGHGFSSEADIRLMYKGIPYFTFDKSNYVLTDYNNKLVATATYNIPADAAEEHTWDAGTITTQPTCMAEGVKTYKCAGCGASKTETVAKAAHSYSSTYTVDKKATTSADGSKSKHCTRSGCTAKTSVTPIYKASSVKLSTVNYTYNGKAQKPAVTVKDSKGTTLKNGTDYTVTYASGRTKIGKYKVTVTFKGNYSGSKALYFEIGPKNPSSVKTTLYGYDDVKVSWSKVSGASGYKVYYKKSSASSWTLLKTTTATSYKKANLSDGVKYDFKVVTYKTVSGNACENAGKTSSIYTLKKVSGVKAVKSSSKVKVSWTNISGETGYQISQSTSKTGTKIVATYKTTSGKYKTVSATKGKTYYYKVRAYTTVGSTKIYGPWSSVVKYKR